MNEPNINSITVRQLSSPETLSETSTATAATTALLLISGSLPETAPVFLLLSPVSLSRTVSITAAICHRHRRPPPRMVADIILSPLSLSLSLSISDTSSYTTTRWWWPAPFRFCWSC
ncbi:hypothetical protein Hanom_Chr03g00233751 [Helianthus anomalus]